MGDKRSPARYPSPVTAAIITDTDPNLYRLRLEYALGVPFADGNRVEILQNGDAIFPAMLAAIAGAQKSIEFLTYVYWGGDIAQAFAQALSQRARQGIEVRVLLDSFGAQRMSGELVDMLLDAGVEVRWFRPLATWRVWRTDKRTHRKILVCDDKISFTGGVGIAEEWTGDAGGVDEWRDSHFSIEGPALAGLKAAFLDNWNEAGDWSWDGSYEKPAAIDNGVPVQVIRSSSTVGWSDTAALLRSLVSISTRSLTIVTPYLVPDTRMVELLCAATRRGVVVHLMIPGKYCDMRLPQLAGQRRIDQLLRNGVHISWYQKTNLHAKIIMVDGLLSCVGSANLNHRSMGKDEECCAVVLCPDIHRKLYEQFDKDSEHAESLTAERWQKRGAWLKFKERMAHLMVEQL